MKISEIGNAARPKFASFNEIGDSYTIVLAEDPQLVVDPLNEDRQMLKLVGVDDDGFNWQINGRTQLPEAVAEAVYTAGASEIVVGGRLTVEFVGLEGRMKVYACQYKPPSDSAAQRRSRVAQREEPAHVSTRSAIHGGR